MGDTRKGSAWFRVPSPAMTVACISLVVALSGASYAAVVLPRNSVGTKQLKRNAVTSPKIDDGAVTRFDVRDAWKSAGLRKADIGAVSTTVTFDPPSIAAGSCSAAVAPVPGAASGDIVIAHPVNAFWGSLIYAPIQAQTNLVFLRLCNPTGGATDGPPLPFRVLLIR